jgi:LPS export ABC transporter protein LptC
MPSRLALAALAAALALLPGPSASAAGADPEQALDLESLTYVDSEGSKSGLVLQARSAHVEPQVRRATLRAVALRLATQDGRGALDLTCDRGSLDLASGSFVGDGRVRGRTPDGRRFETERLRYDHGAALVTTDTPVVIRDAGGTLRGGGFRYQVREGRLKLTGGATVVQDE